MFKGVFLLLDYAICIPDLYPKLFNFRFKFFIFWVSGASKSIYTLENIVMNRLLARLNKMQNLCQVISLRSSRGMGFPENLQNVPAVSFSKTPPHNLLIFQTAALELYFVAHAAVNDTVL